MLAPNCPDHDSLVLDLALGRLDDRKAVEAEDVRHSCAACSEWWRVQLEGESAAVIDSEIGRRFAAFVPPRRRRSIGWMAAAAAIVAAAGIALLWQGAPPTEHNTAAAAPASVTIADDNGIGASEIIAIDGFESGEPTLAASDDEVSELQILTLDHFESGDLSAWSPKT